MEKTFGQAFGDMIREKRGQEGLTQRELAQRAFDDESKVRRIIDLENGVVKRPHVKTTDPLVVYFNISEEELEKCRNYGLFSKQEQVGLGLSRYLLENLALRFEHENADATDEQLVVHLKEKAAELKQLKKRLSEIEETATTIKNQIVAANDALDAGNFQEADEILAAIEEIQQSDRTLKEIRTQSAIRFARATLLCSKGKVR